MQCALHERYAVDKICFIFETVVNEGLKSVKSTINYLKLAKMVKMLVKNYLKWW